MTCSVPEYCKHTFYTTSNLNTVFFISVVDISPALVLCKMYIHETKAQQLSKHSLNCLDVGPWSTFLSDFHLNITE